MTAGLALTAGVSYLIGNSKTVLQTLISTPWLYFGLLIGELVLVMVLVAALNKMSAGVATAIFLAYAALNGVTLSLVLMAYSSGTLTLAFTSTAALFAAMSLIGLTTKIDLTKIGTYAIFALVGLILASLINLFLRSSRLDLILSYAGVLIFTALTAYDTQKISRMASDPQMAEEGPVVLRSTWTSSTCSCSCCASSGGGRAVSVSPQRSCPMGSAGVRGSSVVRRLRGCTMRYPVSSFAAAPGASTAAQISRPRKVS
jgi:FtsH-binding integral membrane protein